MDKTVTLIDAGTGNLRSVLKALESAGGRVHLTHDPHEVRNGGRLVLPGVGAIGDFMNGLRLGGLEQAVLEAVRRGDLLLGICVGMQALFEVGEEMGEHRCLGLLPGRVVRFPQLDGLKVPHTGWNQLRFERPAEIFNGIDSGAYAYFNHSYYCAPQSPETVIAHTDYGVKFSSAVQHANLYGVQFHPEKSQRVGLKLLENFLRL